MKKLNELEKEQAMELNEELEQVTGGMLHQWVEADFDTGEVREVKERDL